MHVKPVNVQSKTINNNPNLLINYIKSKRVSDLWPSIVVVWFNIIVVDWPIMDTYRSIAIYNIGSLHYSYDVVGLKPNDFQ